MSHYAIQLLYGVYTIVDYCRFVSYGFHVVIFIKRHRDSIQSLEAQYNGLCMIKRQNNKCLKVFMAPNPEVHLFSLIVNKKLRARENFLLKP